MTKPITPLCGCDVFILNSNQQVLLIQRSDNGLWALPGGCQNLDETPAACAIRECFEETGYVIALKELLGVWSSLNYPYLTYPWKENVFTHLMFSAAIVSGKATMSEETTKVSWFSEDCMPQLSDGHKIRIEFGFHSAKAGLLPAYFE